jgi:hypothetical protein
MPGARVFSYAWATKSVGTSTIVAADHMGSMRNTQQTPASASNSSGRPLRTTLYRTTRRTSSTAWGRGPADYGHIAYVTTDGGHTAIAYHRPGSDEIIRPARVVRVQFDPEGRARRPTRV